jgi:hypothetical protein
VGEHYGLVPIAEKIARNELPSWAADVPLVITLDMWLANYEVAHNYAHMRDLCRDLQGLGVRPGTVLYIPGWCGPYDGGYPHYEPVAELGGRSAFKEAIEAAHTAGYRIMVHTLGWGADPYVPAFEGMASVAVRNYRDPDNPPPPIVHKFQEQLPPDGSPVPAAPADDPLRGPYVGWPGGGEWFPIDYKSGRRAIGEASRSPNGWIFYTQPVPERCEAVVSLGGLQDVGSGVIKLTVNGRSLTSPAGWFAGHDSYTFPFTYHFMPGENAVEISCFGSSGNVNGMGEGSRPELKAAWFSIDQAYGHDPARNVWTQPAVGTDMNDPAWHRAFCEKLVPTVQTCGVDIVHIDATTLWKWDDRGLFAALKDRLPGGTAFGTEVATEPGLRFFLLHQTGVGNLVAEALSARQGPDEWKPEATDVPWRVSGRYGSFYASLCVPRGFVPTRSVCHVDPVKGFSSEEEIEWTQMSLLLAAKHHIIPTLRLNYRDYGLDDLTKRYLVDHIAGNAASGTRPT